MVKAINSPKSSPETVRQLILIRNRYRGPIVESYQVLQRPEVKPEYILSFLERLRDCLQEPG